VRHFGCDWVSGDVVRGIVGVIRFLRTLCAGCGCESVFADVVREILDVIGFLRMLCEGL